MLWRLRPEPSRGRWECEPCPSPFCLLSAAPEHPAYTPKECFQRISRRLRSTLKRGRIPMVSRGLLGGGGAGAGRAPAASVPRAASPGAVSRGLSPDLAHGH